MANIIKENARGFDCIAPEDLLLTSRKVFLTGEVTSKSCDELLKSLMVLNEADPDKEIELYISSNGGCVSSGLLVYDYIKTMKAPLKTICCGTAASMGAILFLSAPKREMFCHSRLLLHDPSFGSKDIGGKKPLELQKEIDVLMEIREELASIIAEITGKPIEQIYDITKDDTFFNAEEALKLKLATSIIGKKGKRK